MESRKKIIKSILSVILFLIMFTVVCIAVSIIHVKEEFYRENNCVSTVLDCEVVDKYELNKIVTTYYVVVVIMSDHTVHEFKDKYYYYAYDIGDTFKVLEKSWERYYLNEYEIIE